MVIGTPPGSDRSSITSAEMRNFTWRKKVASVSFFHSTVARLGKL